MIAAEIMSTSGTKWAATALAGGDVRVGSSCVQPAVAALDIHVVCTSSCINGPARLGQDDVRAMAQPTDGSPPFHLQPVLSELYHTRDLLDLSAPG